MVTIPLSSNIVNFFYIALFDVTMPIALAWSTAILFSSVNLKIIHDERKVLWLREVPVPHLFNPGVSTRLIGLAVAIASGLVVILPIVGSFSINGVSTPTSKEVSYIVDGATSEDVLDLSQHIYRNETGTYPSSAFLALHWGIFCSSEQAYTHTVYSSFVDTETPRSEWTFDLVQNSLKCRVARNSLETKVAVKLKVRQRLLSLDACKITIPPQFEDRVVQVNATLKGECPFRILEFSCANGIRIFCAGWIEKKKKILLLVKEFPKTAGSSSNTLFNSGRNHIGVYSFSEKPPTESLRSIAHLMAVNFYNNGLESALVVSLLTLKERGTVKTLDTAGETIVNERLFIETVVPAIVLTFGIAIGACASRYFYRIKPERNGYNSFHSARDMLFCAVNEARGHGIISKSSSSGSYFVTSLDEEPCLVQLQKKMKTQREI